MDSNIPIINKRFVNHPVMNVGYFGPIVVVVAPTLNGCSIALLERCEKRFRIKPVCWGEDLADRLSDERVGEYLNPLGIAHCIDGVLSFTESQVARFRTLACAHQLSFAINDPKFDTDILRATDESPAVITVARYILESFDNSGRLSEMSAVARRTANRLDYQEKMHENQPPRFLSQS